MFFMLKLFFAGLIPLLLSYGIFVAGIIGALIFAWFSPVFKKTALWVALSLSIGLGCFTAGDYRGENRIQAKWDLAEKHSVEIGKDARRRALHRVGRMRKSSKDIYNRDGK